MMLGSQCSPCCGPSGGCLNMAALFSQAAEGSPAPFSWFYRDTSGIEVGNTGPVWQGWNKSVDDNFFLPNGDTVRLLFEKDFTSPTTNGWRLSADFWHSATGYAGTVLMSFGCYPDQSYVSTPGSLLEVDGSYYRSPGGVRQVCVKSPGSANNCLDNDGTGTIQDFFGRFVAWEEANQSYWQQNHYLGIVFTDSRWYLRNPLP